jgi:integrase
MASFEKRVSDDGATSYRVKIRLRGHEPVSATFQRLTDAKTWAAQTETELKANRYFGASKRHTVEDLLDHYEKEGVPHLKSARDVKQRLGVWRTRVGHLLLCDLSVGTIKKHKDELKATPKGRGGERSGADVNRTMAALSSALSFAVKELEWLEDNPMVRVRKFAESRGRVRYLSEEELPELLKACRASKNNDLLVAVMLALSTGARQAEVMGLRWKQIDLKAKTALLIDTKNGERRTLPVVGEALDLLIARGKVRTLTDDRVFPAGRRSKKPDAVADLRAPWEAALKAAKIEDFHWHDLRHTCASYMAMSGVSQIEMAKLLGHRTLAMTMRYSHLSPQRTIEVADGLAKRMGI